jgi:uncharacterized protein HemX
MIQTKTIAMPLLVAILPMLLLGLVSIANVQQQQQQISQQGQPQQQQVTPTTSVIHPVACLGGQYEFNGKCVPL